LNCLVKFVMHNSLLNFHRVFFETPCRPDIFQDQIYFLFLGVWIGRIMRARWIWVDCVVIYSIRNFPKRLETSKWNNTSFRTHSRTRSEPVLEGVPNAFRKVFRTRSRRCSERVLEGVPNAFRNAFRTRSQH
jgi:hypothetical protein